LGGLQGTDGRRAAMTEARVPTLQDLVTSLSSPDLMVRVAAIGESVRQPDAYRPVFAAILADVRLPVRPRVWTMIAVCQIQHVGEPAVLRGLLACLADVEPIVRRSAIETLGALRIEQAVPEIAAHLSDHAVIPEAWFDDQSTPSQAAKRALESIGSAEALRFLTGQHS
jgi:HEAT repeat protein